MFEDTAHWMDRHRLSQKTPDWKGHDEYNDAEITVEYYDDVAHKGCRFRGVLAMAEYDGETIARAVRTWKDEDTDYIFYTGGLEGYPERSEAIQIGHDLIKDLIDDYRQKWNDIEAAVETEV